MKAICSVALLGFLMVPAEAAEGSMTAAERSYLLSQLESSKGPMLNSIRDLTSAQWIFKPAPDIWSIEDCAEHLILAEDLLFASARVTMQAPAVTRLPNATSEGDRQIVAQIEDRSVKAKAPPSIRGFPTPESAAKEFSIRRDRTIAYVKTTQDAVRIHAGAGPAAATADVYQILLVMAAHSARHTARIQQVKAAPQYPQAKPRDSNRDGQHDFDFEIGAWKTHLARLLHPLTGSTTWVEYEGTSVVRPVLNGRANLLELDVYGPAGHIEGLSLRLYNPESHQWSLNFASGAGGTLGQPNIGEFKDGRGEFYDQEAFGARTIWVRFVISEITPNSCHFEQAFSDDGGKTWEVNWIATDTRIEDENKKTPRS